ncbi:MAG: hypothetical protein ABSC11_09770 [Smithella sp.]|jgi:hypothetical protein
MYLITISLYPTDKVKEAANMYVKMMTKYPDDTSLMTPIVQVAVRTTLEGIRCIHVSEVKKGKFEAAHDFAVKRMTMFYDIPGYRWTIKPFLDIEEAMKTIGM